MDPASFNSIQGKLRIIKFGLGTDALDEGGGGLLCAAALHTTSRNKVLCRVDEALFFFLSNPYPFLFISGQATGDRVLLGFLAKIVVADGTAKVVLRSPVPPTAAPMAHTIMAILSA